MKTEPRFAIDAPDGGTEAAGALARIRDHLKAKGVDVLVDMIVDLAGDDPALFRRLDVAAAAAQGDDETVEARLRRAIDIATYSEVYIGYREASDWAAGVDAALDAVADLVPSGRAGIALRLVERVVDRIEETFETMDDSNGHRGALLNRAADIHLAAAQAARPEPVQLARDLFAREMESEFDTFADAAGRYADLLGETGLGEYRRLASEAWERLPPRRGARQQESLFSGDYHRLKAIIDFFAERDGDVAARIALRAKDLSSPWAYLELAQFCLSQGLADDALRHAEEGLRLFEDDRPDEQLVFLAVDLLSKAGRKGEAEEHLWRAFRKAPSLELYARFREIGGEGARDRGLTFLDTRVASEVRTQWHSPADLLIRILMQEKMFDRAWATLRRHGASTGVKGELARASEATHPREAIEVHAERVEELAERGGNLAYEEAAQLVARMAALRGAAEQAAYVSALKARFHRKRNFIKLLG